MQWHNPELSAPSEMFVGCCCCHWRINCHCSIFQPGGSSATVTPPRVSFVPYSFGLEVQGLQRAVKLGNVHPSQQTGAGRWFRHPQGFGFVGRAAPQLLLDVGTEQPRSPSALLPSPTLHLGLVTGQHFHCALPWNLSACLTSPCQTPSAWCPNLSNGSASLAANSTD